MNVISLNSRKYFSSSSLSIDFSVLNRFPCPPQCRGTRRPASQQRRSGQQIIAQFPSGQQHQHFIAAATKGEQLFQDHRHLPQRQPGLGPAPAGGTLPAVSVRQPARAPAPLGCAAHRGLLPQHQELPGHEGPPAVPQQEREPV